MRIIGPATTQSLVSGTGGDPTARIALCPACHKLYAARKPVALGAMRIHDEDSPSQRRSYAKTASEVRKTPDV